MLRNWVIWVVFAMLLGCDVAALKEEDDLQKSIQLRAYDDLTFSSGRQSIDVDTTEGFHHGVWSSELNAPEVWAATFAGMDLWLAGVQDGTVRANTTQKWRDFSFSYVLADSQDVPMYLVNTSDLQSTIANWPSGIGAPVDAHGNPVIYGDEMVWNAMVSDYVFQRFNFNPARSFDSLLMSRTVFGFYDSIFKDVYFIRYDISNVANTDIVDMRIGFYTSTLLTIFHSEGRCDTQSTGFDLGRKISYTYSSREETSDRCRTIVSGFTFSDVSKKSGETIEIGSHLLVRKHTIEPGFAQPDFSNSTAIFNALNGLSATGEPMIDPTTGLETMWAFTGNPVSGTGWIDRVLTSPRSLLSTEAFTLAVGESVSITIAIMTVQGKDLEAGIEELLLLSDAVQSSRDRWSNPSR